MLCTEPGDGVAPAVSAELLTLELDTPGPYVRLWNRW